MDPACLPGEVADCIFGVLPLQDIISSCMVSSQWRDAVNKNCVWKKFCKLSPYLENKPCIVSPAFKPPPCETDLSPVCKWRVNYMREVHLKNNVKNNRFTEYKLSKILQDKVEFLGNYLLLNDPYRNIFQVWDIEGEPNLIQSVPYIFKENCLETFQTVGENLIIVQCNLLQVYSVVDDLLSLRFCRVFDQEEEFSDQIPTTESVSSWSWYLANIGLYSCDFTSINEIVGNYFIGIVECPQQELYIMHIWNIASGKKLKIETIPGSESVENIRCGKNSECLYLILYFQTQSLSWITQKRCKILSYSLKNLEFTVFNVESDYSAPFMLFGETVVLLPCDQLESSGSYLFLNSSTGKTLVQKKFDNPINPNSCDFYKSKLVFGSSNTVTIVEVDLQDVVSTFQVDFEVMEVYLLDGDLLLVGGADYDFVLQMWDLKTVTMLYSLDEKSILLCGRTLLRICFQSLDSIHIHNFW